MADTIQKSAKVFDVSTTLAVDRTRLSHERTLMAWVRTSTSLITFGFTIYKFFQIELPKEASRTKHLIGPTAFALLMISIGLVALLMATVEHRRDLKALRAEYPGIPGSLATVLAGLISILGLFALILILFRQ